jgi:hypothetical protein
MTDNNPYINPQNYYEGYEINETSTPSVPLDELCWHVFNTDDGKKLLEIMEKRFIAMPTPGPVNENYPNMCVFYEGYREAFRQIIGSVQSYQIKMDNKAKEAGV